MGGPMEKKLKSHKNYMHHNDISDSGESSSDERVNKKQIIKTKPLKTDGENSAFHHSKIKTDFKTADAESNKMSQIKQEEKVKMKRKSFPKFESSSDEQGSEEGEQGDTSPEETINRVPIATSSDVEGKHIKEEKLTQSEKSEIDTENKLPNKHKKIKIIQDPQNINETKKKHSRISKNTPIKEKNKTDNELEKFSPKKIKHKYAKTVNENLCLEPVEGSKKKLRDSFIIEPTVLYPLSENIVIKQETNDEPEKKRKLKKISSLNAGENNNEVITLKMQPLDDMSDSDSQCEMLEFSDTDSHRKLKLVEEEIDELSLENSDTKDEYFFELLSQSDIVMTWEIPALHTMTPDVTRHPSEEVRQEIVKSGVPWARGRFSPDEEKIIRRNWRRLCVRYNLPDCPEVFGRWRNKKNNRTLQMARKKAVLFLARGLPDRTLVQVYHHFIHRLGAKTKGRFSENEKLMVEAYRTDEQYKDLTQHFLGSVLGRDPPSIWRYITNLKLKEKSNSSGEKVKWTLELCEKFIKILLRLVNEEQDRSPESLDLEVLRAPINIEIWRNLGKEMNLTPLQVKVQWLSKLYVQIFVTEPIYMTALRYKLLEVASTKQMPVLSKTLDLKYLSHKKKASLKWGSINAALFGVLIYDLKYKCQYYTTWLHYVEYCLIIVFGLNAIYHCLRYLYHTFIMSPVLVTARQKSLLGFKDHDNSYRIQSPSSFRPVPQDSSPPAPINLSTRSWLSNSTVNESLNQSSASPSWVYSRGSPSMPNYKPQQLSFNEMPDSVVNEQTFREYLRNAEEMDKNESIINSSAAGDSPKERSIFWNHPSTRTGNELSPVFKKNQYQLAPLNSEIPHASGVNEEGSPKSPQISSLNIWTNQQIDPLLLTQWNANIRNWISTTILARVVKEIKEIDGALLKLGLTDVRIGHVGLDRLKKTAQTLQIMHHVPTLSILMPFMELSNNQEYLVQRIKELSSGGCMSDFKWNGGGNLHGKSWDETLPTDSAIIMHFVATYLDTQLLPVSQNSYPEDPPFTTQHLCKVPDKPRRGPDALIIHQTSLSPPHYVLIIGEETREIPKGRNNLIHTLLLFLHTVAVKHHGMLGRVNLGKSGVNVLWVVDQ